VPLKVTAPAVGIVPIAVVIAETPEATHTFEPNVIIVIAPSKIVLAPRLLYTPNPVVKFAVPTPVVITDEEPVYPDVVGLPEPICTK
jgi:hypothetical protein